jgi:hypothetical protein
MCSFVVSIVVIAFEYFWETCFLAEVFFFVSSLFRSTFDGWVVIWSLRHLRSLIDSFSSCILSGLYTSISLRHMKVWGGVTVYT